MPKPRDPLAEQGWVPIQHAGNETVRDVQRDVAGPDDEATGGGNTGASVSAVDPAGPAEKEPSFDVESPPIQIKGSGDPDEASGRGRSRAGARAGRDEGKLDTVLHKVEPNENFWTISRMYYSSGRYYKALWKANANRVPRIDQLHVETVIRVPPPEDLDPAYIDPPGARAARPRTEDLASHQEAHDATAAPAPAAARPSQGDGVPIRRSGRSDPDLTLPVADASDADTPAADRKRSSRARNADFQDDRDPDVRPRDAVTRPIYKVRQYDTLRSIARDTMGDARRADEILDLNRDILDDPSHLIVGQLLELPEDARAVRPRRGR
jgi:nucleoid-associated protein YgaU